MKLSMQEKHLFEYSVIRFVPMVEREEFLNVGVILYSRKMQFLQARFALNESRLKAFYKDVDIEELEQYLHAFSLIAAGNPEGGPISRLDIASRFRWLTATRSTIVQTSRPHSGLCPDPLKALQRLFEQLVL
jgi:hypothetical protein